MIGTKIAIQPADPIGLDGILATLTFEEALEESHHEFFMDLVQVILESEEDNLLDTRDS